MVHMHAMPIKTRIQDGERPAGRVEHLPFPTFVRSGKQIAPEEEMIEARLRLPHRKYLNLCANYISGMLTQSGQYHPCCVGPSRHSVAFVNGPKRPQQSWRPSGTLDQPGPDHLPKPSVSQHHIVRISVYATLREPTGLPFLMCMACPGPDR
ncbi:hypothetical protein LZ30DRAFT_307164 [Colletotrichum cereale]|nr:hypothetical protein LZ30DRAFT_307164 [Colletotrichum cereale]